MLKKIQQNLLSTNKNVYDLQKKNTDKSLHTSNKDSMSFSQIIGNSGWYNIQAKKSYFLQKSADPAFNNVIVAPYVFLFPDVELEENELKNLNFIVETKPNSNVQPITLKQWGATQCNLTSDGYKIYTPGLVWKGSRPGLTLFGENNASYIKPAWWCSFIYQSLSIGSILREIYGNYTYVLNGDTHEVDFWMKSFDAVSNTEATGNAYIVDYNVNQATTDKGFDAVFNVIFADTTRTWGKIDYFNAFTTEDSCALKFRLDRQDQLDSAIDFNALEYTPYYVAYYEANYFYPIVYGTTSLRYLPTLNENIALDSLRLTIGENSEIVSTDTFVDSGVTASGQTFCYYKKSNGKYEVRIIGGIVYETIPKQSYGDGNTFPTTQENYKLVGSQWTYDSTETLSELDIPYYYPLEQDVQIRCLLNYTPLNQHTSFEKK